MLIEIIFVGYSYIAYSWFQENGFNITCEVKPVSSAFIWSA